MVGVEVPQRESFTARETAWPGCYGDLKKLFEHTSNALFDRPRCIAGLIVSITLAYQLFQYFYNPTPFYNSVGYVDAYVSVGYGLYD